MLIMVVCELIFNKKRRKRKKTAQQKVSHIKTRPFACYVVHTISELINLLPTSIYCGLWIVEWIRWPEVHLFILIYFYWFYIRNKITHLVTLMLFFVIQKWYCMQCVCNYYNLTKYYIENIYFYLLSNFFLSIFKKYFFHSAKKVTRNHF